MVLLDTTGALFQFQTCLVLVFAWVRLVSRKDEKNLKKTKLDQMDKSEKGSASQEVRIFNIIANEPAERRRSAGEAAENSAG